MFYHPLGRGTKSDAHYLYGVFNKDFIKEFDELIAELKEFEFSEPPTVKVIENNQIITEEKVKALK